MCFTFVAMRRRRAKSLLVDTWPSLLVDTWPSLLVETWPFTTTDETFCKAAICLVWDPWGGQAPVSVEDVVLNQRHYR